MSDQHALFPHAPKQEQKRKAKTLPKQVQLPAAAPARKLSPHDELAQARNLASVRNARAKLKIGELVLSDDPCRDCGGKRIGEVIGVEPEGGLTIEWRCMQCSTSL